MKLRNDIRDKLFAELEKNTTDWRRNHLGASAIGEACLRKVWLNYRWVIAPNFEGRVLSLFRRGGKEEEIYEEDFGRVEEYRYVTTDSDGEQFKFSAVHGHFGGSTDGFLFVEDSGEGIWYLVEIKTYNKNRFATLENTGVEMSDPKYFVQMQCYLGFTKLLVALFCGTCKDNDKRHFEEVDFIPDEFEEAKEKAEYIVYTKDLPPKISQNPSAFACKWCAYHALCHKKTTKGTEINCRTCFYGEPSEISKHGEGSEGKWICAKRVRKTFMDTEQQKKPCIHHRTILNIL